MRNSSVCTTFPLYCGFPPLQSVICVHACTHIIWNLLRWRDGSVVTKGKGTLYSVPENQWNHYGTARHGNLSTDGTVGLWVCCRNSIHECFIKCWQWERHNAEHTWDMERNYNYLRRLRWFSPRVVHACIYILHTIITITISPNTIFYNWAKAYL
jgi:hypothetical protein